MNETFERVRNTIVDNYENFDMSQWYGYDKLAPANENLGVECGTVLCLAGFAALDGLAQGTIAGFDPTFHWEVKTLSGRQRKIRNWASWYLGVSPDAFYLPFNGSNPDEVRLFLDTLWNDYQTKDTENHGHKNAVATAKGDSVSITLDNGDVYTISETAFYQFFGFDIDYASTDISLDERMIGVLSLLSSIHKKVTKNE